MNKVHVLYAGGGLPSERTHSTIPDGIPRIDLNGDAAQRCGQHQPSCPPDGSDERYAQRTAVRYDETGCSID